jgi:hypothetical protein
VTTAVHSGLIGGVAGVAIKATPSIYRANKIANGQNVTPEYAIQYFMDRGMSRAEAAGLESQINSESHGKANAVGDSGHAYGLIQWHEDRQANFKKQYGHDIQHSTADEQLSFIVHELMAGTERAAQKKIAAAPDARSAAEAASRYFVRPADVEGEARKRGNYAAMLDGISGASSTAAMAGNTHSGPSTSNTDNSVNVTGPITIHTNATDANGVAAGFVKGVSYQYTAAANSGLR